jgi:hypothetical protein
MLMVVINGTAGVGKDTFIKYVNDNTDLIIKNISTIDPIKKAMLNLGWNGEKDENSRLMMAKIKQLWIKHYNGCFEFTKHAYYKYQNKKDIVFVHCREPNEITKIVNGLYNVITLLIKNDTGLAIPYKNGADDVVDEYLAYDYIINNNGDFNDLEQAAIKFVNDLQENKLI